MVGRIVESSGEAGRILAAMGVSGRGTRARPAIGPLHDADPLSNRFAVAGPKQKACQQQSSRQAATRA